MQKCLPCLRHLETLSREIDALGSDIYYRKADSARERTTKIAKLLDEMVKGGCISAGAYGSAKRHAEGIIRVVGEGRWADAWLKKEWLNYHESDAIEETRKLCEEEWKKWARSSSA
jgi:GH24 family phage-related lysozyme (muramidase)